MTKSYLTDVAVALIFFNRPDCLQRTFDAIRTARPSKLFLIQDGPRDNRPDDVKNIALCRDIVSKINWECEVTELFSDVNLGCGMRVYTGLNDTFKEVDKLVIIEDDIVIGESFLPFCKEMLDRYENDQRIGMISGMNHLGVYKDCPYDYFFSSQGGSIWGWATWKRVWDDMDWALSCADDEYANRIIISALYNNSYAKSVYKNIHSKRTLYLNGEKQTSWSFQFGYSTGLAQSRLNIVPRVNMISNIGVTKDSVHSSPLFLIPRKLRCVYNAKTYVIPTPIKHPRLVINDMRYAKKQADIMGMSHLRQISRMFESILYRIFPILGRI